LEFIIRKLRVQNLTAQVALRRYVCEFLAREFQTPTLTTHERAALARRWDITLKESYVFHLMLDLIERQEKEERVRRQSWDSNTVSENCDLTVDNCKPLAADSFPCSLGPLVPASHSPLE
jgi:hypothetical protein